MKNKTARFAQLRQILFLTTATCLFYAMICAIDVFGATVGSVALALDTYIPVSSWVLQDLPTQLMCNVGTQAEVNGICIRQSVDPRDGNFYWRNFQITASDGTLKLLQEDVWRELFPDVQGQLLGASQGFNYIGYNNRPYLCVGGVSLIPCAPKPSSGPDYLIPLLALRNGMALITVPYSDNQYGWLLGYSPWQWPGYLSGGNEVFNDASPYQRPWIETSTYTSTEDPGAVPNDCSSSYRFPSTRTYMRSRALLLTNVDFADRFPTSVLGNDQNVLVSYTEYIYLPPYQTTPTLADINSLSMHGSYIEINAWVEGYGRIALASSTDKDCGVPVSGILTNVDPEHCQGNYTEDADWSVYPYKITVTPDPFPVDQILCPNY